MTTCGSTDCWTAATSSRGTPSAEASRWQNRWSSTTPSPLKRYCSDSPPNGWCATSRSPVRSDSGRPGLPSTTSGASPNPACNAANARNNCNAPYPDWDRPSSRRDRRWPADRICCRPNTSMNCKNCKTTSRVSPTSWHSKRSKTNWASRSMTYSIWSKTNQSLPHPSDKSTRPASRPTGMWWHSKSSVPIAKTSSRWTCTCCDGGAAFTTDYSNC
mmetsp:Transcript_24909/g.69915  ORF Transcript_24909/g.69915 Transcript_24909/m.69915 type:complete len:216 (-) Transcript_24909:1496-2143(-)